MAKEIARRYAVSGKVQGVGYRYFAEREASRLGVRGYVKNLSDGSVEVYAVGEATKLDTLRLRLAEGPRAARVSAIEESEEVIDRRYSTFVVEGGW